MTSVPTTEVKVPVEPRDSDGRQQSIPQMRVQVEGPKHVTARLVPDGNRMLATFETDLTGEYTVTVICANGKPTVDTPVRVTVNEGRPGEEDKSKAPLERNHNVTFECDAKAIDGKTLTSTSGVTHRVSGPSVRADSQISYHDGKFHIDFSTHELGGDFAVEVLHNGQHIYRSPFSVLPAGRQVEGTVRQSDFKETVAFEIEAELQNGSKQIDTRRVKVNARPSLPSIAVSDIKITPGPHPNITVVFAASVPPNTNAEIVCDVSQDGTPFSTSPVTIQLSND